MSRSMSSDLKPWNSTSGHALLTLFTEGHRGRTGHESAECAEAATVLTHSPAGLQTLLL